MISKNKYGEFFMEKQNNESFKKQTVTKADIDQLLKELERLGKDRYQREYRKNVKED
jgi:hypothetical protein